MYLVPLNYDKFFKKVFSDKKIAKKFIEDFLEIEIEEIELLPTKHKITNDATHVEFDYRCKILNNYVIIDMQQWYKPDIIHRFFVYHCLNTSLQLEDIQKKALPKTKNKPKHTIDYRAIEPVITLIWLVNDNIGYDDNYVAFSLMHNRLLEFINNEDVWNDMGIKKIRDEREEILKILNNDRRDIDFLAKNKLIFMLQKNIIKSSKMKKYERWFKFAEKTLDKDNKETDFNEFKNDEVFKEVIRRLDTKELTESEIKYAEDEEEIVEMLKRYDVGIREEGIKEGKREGRKEGIKEGRTEEKREIAKNLLNLGIDVEAIVKATGLTLKEIQEIKESVK